MRCSPRTGLKGMPPRSTTSLPSSPAWAAAGRPGCETCSAPSRPTRTPSSARDPAALSSSTAVRVRARPSSLCTAPPTSSTPTLASVTAGAEGVQTCTLRGLVAEGAAAAIETDPDVARLKSSADLVNAIETAVRFYENPPARGMTVETHWSDIWLSADDWAEALEAPDPGTPHNEAREEIWEELLAILTDKHDGDVPADLRRKSLLQNRELHTALNRAWPLIEAADLVGDLWSVPAYLRLCAPWLSPDDVQQLQREDAQAWTVSDLPLLDV